jgi:hypothetical protein
MEYHHVASKHSKTFKALKAAILEAPNKPNFCLSIKIKYNSTNKPAHVRSWLCCKLVKLGWQTANTTMASFFYQRDDSDSFLTRVKAELQQLGQQFVEKYPGIVQGFSFFISKPLCATDPGKILDLEFLR